jgi:hypothetical protein
MPSGPIFMSRIELERLDQRPPYWIASDPAFGEALLREGIDSRLVGDVDTGKAILRDYIKATVGFEKLGEATCTQPKSLIRMFGLRCDPAS